MKNIYGGDLAHCLSELGFVYKDVFKGIWAYKEGSKLLYVAYWGSYTGGHKELVCIENITTGRMSKSVSSVEKLKELFNIERRNTNLNKILEK